VYITGHDVLCYVLNAGHKLETAIMLTTIFIFFSMHFITSTILLRTL